MADIKDDLINRIGDELDSLSDLKDKEKKLKNADIIERIRDFRSLTDVIEDRRNNVINFTYQYIVILIAILGFFISDTIKLHCLEKSFIFITLGLQLITSFLIVVIYTFQSNFEYPFNHEKYVQFGNKWKWFYYGNKHISEISENPIFPSYSYENFFKPYLKGFHQLIDNYKNENIDSEIKSNIQQLYLLQVHNYYKNRFYLQLTRIQKYSMGVTIVIVFIYFVLKVIDLL